MIFPPNYSFYIPSQRPVSQQQRNQLLPGGQYKQDEVNVAGPVAGRKRMQRYRSPLRYNVLLHLASIMLKGSCFRRVQQHLECLFLFCTSWTSLWPTTTSLGPEYTHTTIVELLYCCLGLATDIHCTGVWLCTSLSLSLPTLHGQLQGRHSTSSFI